MSDWYYRFNFRLYLVSFPRFISLAAIGALSVLAGMQFIPTRRTNPPSYGELTAPPQVETTFRRACYDCHSNATRWPWYSRVAPFSWLVIHHVTLGRQEVNFSEWSTYYPATRRRKLEWIGRALHQENMPPWSYRLMHPAARLTDSDRAVLEEWIDSKVAALSTRQSTR